MTADRPGSGHRVPPVYLHIGAMKTGTSYIQRVLDQHQDEVAAAGVLFPGETWNDQVRAAQEVADSVPADPVVQAQVKGSWAALVDEVLSHEGTSSLVSMEFLSHADRAGAGRAVSSLEPAEVHVVLTVRDAAATIPALWQTSIRNGRVLGWPDYCDGVRKATGLRARTGRFAHPAAMLFRRTQDTARILEAWGEHVPSERIHVVTVPPAGAEPTLLWRRFAGVVGLDPEIGQVSRAHESLGYASTELLRRVNLALGKVPASDYNATLRGRLSHGTLAARRREESRVRLDRATYDFALAWNQRSRDAVQRSGAHLVGDLDDLPVTPAPHHEAMVDDDQAPPTDVELLAAAEDALEGVRAIVRRRSRKAAGRGLDTSVIDRAERAGSETVRAQAADPVEAAVTEIAELCRAAIELRRRLKTRA